MRRFGITESLLDIGNDGAAGLADESGQSQLGTDFRGTGNGAANRKKLADVSGAHGAHTRDEGQVVKGNGEELVGLLVGVLDAKVGLAGVGASRAGSCRGVGAGRGGLTMFVKVLGFVGGDSAVKGGCEEGKEAVVRVCDGLGESTVLPRGDVLVVDVEGG